MTATNSRESRASHHARFEPSVSVVIPTRNSARTLTECLASLRAQTLQPTEVIVSDNQSVDITREIAQSFGAILLRRGPERSAQRNAGAAVARGTHLLFIDSDMSLGVNVIRECVEQANAGREAVVIPERVVGDSYWAKCRELEKRLGEGVPGYEAARFVDASVFRRVGGYDESLVAGEDFDLHIALADAGTEFGRTRDQILHHEEALTLLDYIRKWRYYRATLEPFIIKRGAIRREVPSLIRVTIARFPLALHHPRELVGLVLLKVVEFAIIGWRGRFPLLNSRIR